MSVAFLFPGQGVDAVAACHDWVRHSAGVRGLMEVTASAVGLSADELLDGGGRHFSRTEVVQPVLAALCLGIHQELRSVGIRPGFVAGHSFGEIPASAAAGFFADDAAVGLAALRGRLMAREASKRPGGMLALVGIQRETVEAALTIGRAFGEVHLAAWNAPNEWVVTGEPEALRRIAAQYRSVPLAVAGAWHGPQMAPAVEELRRALQEAAQSRPAASFVCNRSGLPVDDPEDIPDLLAEQLVRPVLWAKTLETLADAGVADFVTVGPGKVLRAQVRRTLGSRARVLGTESPEDFSQTVEALG